MKDSIPLDIHRAEQTEAAARDIVRTITQLLRAFVAEGWPFDVACDLTFRTLRSNMQAPPDASP